MKFFRTTNTHKEYWRQRKIDWKVSYSDTWTHPHRQLIVEVLSQFRWKSLIEIGCGSGANLIKIVQSFQGVQVGGMDINKDAIELASKTFTGAHFGVGSGDNIMMSDKSTDCVLVDAVYIYVGSFQIRKYIREAKRIARNYIVLCEFHSESWWNRLALKINTGYNAYDYKKLLESEGFYDVVITKIPKEAWSGTPWQEFGYILVAKIPTYV